MRHYSFIDQLIRGVDKALRSRFLKPELEDEKARSIGLMRVNHSGEISAQALYYGQAFLARDPLLKEKLKKAAREEASHLEWCRSRVKELGGRTSVFTPLWAVGSFGIGAFVGLLGDKISLGFLAETEYQVSAHLEGHLHRLPESDLKSREILIKMREDELRHAENALQDGGVPFPLPARLLMRMTAKIMTFTARYI